VANLNKNESRNVKDTEMEAGDGGGGKKLGKKARELRPRTLLRAMATQGPATSDDLKKIVARKYSSPVVSLYLGLNQEKVAPQPKGWLRTFHSRRTRALEERKDFLASLPRQQRYTVDHDMEEIEAFLTDHFVPENLRALVILRAGQELNRVIKLWVRVPDALVIDPDPFILPLEAVLETNERVLFAEVSKEESRFSVYHMEVCQPAQRIQSFVPSDTVDNSVPSHEQRHRLAHLQRHMKETAHAAERLWRERSCTALVLMAEARIMALLDEYLHESLKAKVIGRILDPPDGDPRDRKELIENALREYQAAKEEKAVAELADFEPGKSLVSSLPQVIDACNRFAARRLLVNESLREKGFVCSGHHYVSLKEGECPVDGKKLLPVEHVVDELVECARLHGAKVTVIEKRQDLLAKYGGIAAVQFLGAATTA